MNFLLRLLLGTRNKELGSLRQDLPPLRASPGDLIPLRYQENGHVFFTDQSFTKIPRRIMSDTFTHITHRDMGDRLAKRGDSLATDFPALSGSFG